MRKSNALKYLRPAIAANLPKREMDLDTSTAIKPVFPNAGSQAELLFNILGFSRGELTYEVNYPQEQIDSVRTILKRHDWELPYPEALQPKLTLHNIDFEKGLKPKSRIILDRCGNGNGKTTLGAIFAYGMSVAYPNSEGLIIANTYDQLRDSTIKGFVKFYLAHNIPFEPWKGNIPETVRSILSRKSIVINGCTHTVRSADSFTGGETASQSGRGIEASHAIVDEGLRLPDATLLNVLATRVRMKNIPSMILITSTINTDNPYNWGWEYFDNPDTKREGFASVTGSSVENLHRLSETYVQDMYSTMTPDLFRIEVLGEYVGITTGRLVKYFSREMHVFGAEYFDVNPTYPIYLSIDFNYNPATAIAAQMIDEELRIIREWHLTDSNTFELGANIREWLDSHKPRQIIVTGDATGGQRTANSRLTNWQIIQDSFKGLPTRYVFGKANPEIQDTVNAINTAFAKDRIILSNECRELIKDLETATYPYDKFKKKNEDRSHWLDELRYLVHYLMPYRKQTKEQPIGMTGLIV